MRVIGTVRSGTRIFHPDTHTRCHTAALDPRVRPCGSGCAMPARLRRCVCDDLFSHLPVRGWHSSSSMKRCDPASCARLSAPDTTRSRLALDSKIYPSISMCHVHGLCQSAGHYRNLMVLGCSLPCHGVLHTNTVMCKYKWRRCR